MKTSKTPVMCANRAELIECDENAFNVGAVLTEKTVALNVYAEGGTRVLCMSPDEAEEIARYLLDAARAVRESGAREMADPYYAAQLKARMSRARTASGE
jgi:hypothetical protein